MTITGSYSVTVINDYKIAITGVRRRIDHKPIGGSGKPRSEVDSKIQALMDFSPLTAEKISSHSQALRYVSLPRYAPRNRSHTKNVGTQMVIDVAYVALQLISCFIQRYYRFRAPNTD